jgi:hypothetical protein
VVTAVMKKVFYVIMLCFYRVIVTTFCISIKVNAVGKIFLGLVKERGCEDEQGKN